MLRERVVQSRVFKYNTRPAHRLVKYLFKRKTLIKWNEIKTYGLTTFDHALRVHADDNKFLSPDGQTLCIFCLIIATFNTDNASSADWFFLSFKISQYPNILLINLDFKIIIHPPTDVIKSHPFFFLLFLSNWRHLSNRIFANTPPCSAVGQQSRYLHRCLPNIRIFTNSFFSKYIVKKKME